MHEIPETLLEKTSDLLDTLIPIMQRSIEALQHNPNPLAQHLIQQEIKHQEGLLEQIAEIKERLHDCLNPPDEVTQPTQSHHIIIPEPDLHPDLHPDKIADGLPALSVGSPPVGAAVRKPYPLTVTIPDRKSPICERYAIDTLIEVIKVLGIEKVRALGMTLGPIPLVAIKKYDGCQQKEVERYYIAAKSTTFIKARQIDMIGDFLEIELNVKQNHIVSVSNYSES